MKQLLEFSQDSETENGYELRISVFDVEAKQVKDIRAELDALPASVKYTTIEGDGIGATILGSYEKVMESLKILETSGWTW